MAAPQAPRTAVLIVCHGALAEALLETAVMLVGPQPDAWAIAFMPGESPEDLEGKVRAALARLEPGDGALCLVDIPGGVPARVLGAPTMAPGSTLETVSGANLPMLAEALLRRDHAGLPALAEFAARAGREGIVNLGPALRAAVARSS